MKAKAVFNAMVSQSGMRKVEISRTMGRRSSFISNRINSSSLPGIEIIAEVADACGFDLLVRKRSDGSEMFIDPPERD